MEYLEINCTIIRELKLREVSRLHGPIPLTPIRCSFSFATFSYRRPQRLGTDTADRKSDADRSENDDDARSTLHTSWLTDSPKEAGVLSNRSHGQIDSNLATGHISSTVYNCQLQRISEQNLYCKKFVYQFHKKFLDDVFFSDLSFTHKHPAKTTTKTAKFPFSNCNYNVTTAENLHNWSLEYDLPGNRIGNCWTLNETWYWKDIRKSVSCKKGISKGWRPHCPITVSLYQIGNASSGAPWNWCNITNCNKD